MKRIESACLVQTLIFDSLNEYEMYKKRIGKRHIPFREERIEYGEDNCVMVQMRRCYGHYPVGEYLQ